MHIYPNICNTVVIKSKFIPFLEIKASIKIIEYHQNHLKHKSFTKLDISLRTFFCPVQLKVFESHSNTKYIACRTIADHDHSSITRKNKIIDKEMREHIFQLKYDDGMKPLRIGDNFRRNMPEQQLPSIRQVRYAIDQVAQEKILPTFSFGELTSWLKQESDIPSTQDKAFVLDWFHKAADKTFCFVVSSVRLLAQASEQKIVWQGFPLIVIGFIDRMKHVHLIAMCLTSNEREAEYKFAFSSVKMGVEMHSKKAFAPDLLISDSAAAIRNGVFAVYGRKSNVICSVHLFRNLRQQKFLNKTNKPKILRDVYTLHTSADHIVFENAVDLFPP